MTNLLVKLFIKNSNETEKMSVRTAYGVLASIAGIFCNVLLFAVKGIMGILLKSVSVTADAFNNLSDAGSSIIGLIGVKIAGKPADEEHPFGHGRMEYITALIVAFLVMQLGFTFLKEAVLKIRNPEAMKFQLIPVLILVASIGVKIWLGLFNRKLGQRVNSQVMLATATDAWGDVLTTSATIFAIILYRTTGINLDGYIGVIVSLVVMWAGFSIARDTIEPLIGQRVPLEEYQSICGFVERYDGIVGTHDLIVHNYGPGRKMASIHAEVPNDVSIEISHEIIDRIELDAKEKLGIFLVIHMDPVETKNELVLQAKEHVLTTLERLDERVSIHDFRLVDGEHQINLIFDMVVPYEYDKERQESLRNQIQERMNAVDNRYQCVILIEQSYVELGNREQ